MKQDPINLLARALVLWVKGSVHLGKNLKKETLIDGNENFIAFRKIMVDPNLEQFTPPGAIFQVRFRFKNLPEKTNRFLSIIPIPLIVAQPGFLSKTWFLGNDTGDFIGFYEFDSIDKAEMYWDSLPLRMMRNRAVPGSLRHEVRLAASSHESSNK